MPIGGLSSEGGKFHRKPEVPVDDYLHNIQTFIALIRPRAIAKVVKVTGSTCTKFQRPN